MYGIYKLKCLNWIQVNKEMLFFLLSCVSIKEINGCFQSKNAHFLLILTYHARST